MRRFSVQGKPARAVLEVTAHQVFFHCGKSLIRSRLWDPAQWPDRSGLAGLGAALADQIKTIGAPTAEAMVAESIAKRLYIERMRGWASPARARMKISVAQAMFEALGLSRSCLMYRCNFRVRRIARVYFSQLQ